MLAYSTSWGMEPQMSTQLLFSWALRLWHCAVLVWKTRTEERTARTDLNMEPAMVNRAITQSQKSRPTLERP